MFLSGDTAFYEVFSNLISRYHNVVSPKSEVVCIL